MNWLKNFLIFKTRLDANCIIRKILTGYKVLSE